MSIHPTALVSPQAEIDSTTEIGPYVLIEGKVKLGPHNRILSHVCIYGDTTMGPGNVVHPFSTLGNDPQDLSYQGEPTTLVIGAENTFREGCSIHRGTPAGGGTIIGNSNFFMSNSHVGHDSRISDHVVMANGVLLGGHVHVDDHAFLSGNVVVHQFCRIGRHSMLGGASGYSKDVPPFCTGSTGKVNHVMGLNVVGLRRSGYSVAERQEIKRVYQEIYLSGHSISQALARLETNELIPPAREMVEFIRNSKRGICRHAR